MKRSDITWKDLPTKPGVYQFLDTQKEILYIGKATSLRDRVRSYFNDDLIHTRGPLLVDMVTKSTHLKWIETESVLEALILESNLIKKHQPLYNTKEKDNKSYFYVVVTREDFPRIFLERGRVLQNKNELSYKVKDTFGPYPSGASIKEALKIIRKIFPFRDRRSNQQSNQRFYKQLGLIPDVGDREAQERYKEHIRHIKLFFQGKKRQVIRELEKQMHAYAENQEFEDAARVRNQIFALQHIRDISLIKKEVLDAKAGQQVRIEGYDVAHLQGKAMTGVMVVFEGVDPDKSQYRSFNIRDFDRSNDTGALQEVLRRRFRHTEWPMPSLMVIDGGKAQLNAAKAVLKELGLKIPTCSVVKDERHKPREILMTKKIEESFDQNVILLVNSEAHRFSVTRHRTRLRKNR